MEKLADQIKKAYDSQATKKAMVLITFAIASAWVATNGHVQIVIGG